MPAKRDYVSIAKQYCLDIVSGVIPACKWTKLACQRQLDDLARQNSEDFPYIFDIEKAVRVCRFIEKLPHVKGEWAKRKEKIFLQPWQVFILAAVFGWVHLLTGLRRFRWVYEEVARKNAKSTKMAGVGLYCMGAEGEAGAEVYSAASKKEQAKIIWTAARQMVEKTAGLRKFFGISTTAHSIIKRDNASIFKPLGSNDDTEDGLNISLGILDELHAHKSRGMFDVIETGTGSREQPLIWSITTAGQNRECIAKEQRSYVEKILSGVLKDESYFGIIFSVDPEDLETDAVYTDPAIWQKANPNYGISVDPVDLAAKAAKALRLPSARSNFLTKHCNVWVSSDNPWMDMLKWDSCADPSLDIADFAGQPCVVALDLASKVDLVSFIILFWKEIDSPRGFETHYYAFCTNYLPEETIELSRVSSYRGWEAEGYIISTPGAVIDFDLVEEDLKALPTTYQIQVEGVGYDPFQATQLATHLIDDNVPMVEIRQTVQNLSEPMKDVLALVYSNRLHHDGNPVLAWAVSNVVCHTDKKDNIFPNKERYEDKIDPAVALIMARKMSMIQEADELGGKSIYESEARSRGVVCL